MNRLRPLIALALSCCVLVATACSAPGSSQPSEATTPAAATATPTAPNTSDSDGPASASPDSSESGAAATQNPSASSHPAVAYKPASPEATTKNRAGHQVNTCVPTDLREKATTLTAKDGAHLSALVLGSGSKGVVLSHEQGYYICSFLELGKRLAAKGYLVVIPEFRGHGASEAVPSGPASDKQIVMDEMTAVAEARRLGATELAYAGASCGGSASAVAASKDPSAAALVMLSSPDICGEPTALSAMKKVTAPTMIVGSREEFDGNVMEGNERMRRASASKKMDFVVLEGGEHGTDNLRSKSKPDGAALTDRVEKFIVDGLS